MSSSFGILVKSATSFLFLHFFRYFNHFPSLNSVYRENISLPTLQWLYIVRAASSRIVYLRTCQNCQKSRSKIPRKASFVVASLINSCNKGKEPHNLDFPIVLRGVTPQNAEHKAAVVGRRDLRDRR